MTQDPAEPTFRCEALFRVVKAAEARPTTWAMGFDNRHLGWINLDPQPTLLEVQLCGIKLWIEGPTPLELELNRMSLYPTSRATPKQRWHLHYFRGLRPDLRHHAVTKVTPVTQSRSSCGAAIASLVEAKLFQVNYFGRRIARLDEWQFVRRSSFLKQLHETPALQRFVIESCSLPLLS